MCPPKTRLRSPLEAARRLRQALPLRDPRVTHGRLFHYFRQTIFRRGGCLRAKIAAKAAQRAQRPPRADQLSLVACARDEWSSMLPSLPNAGPRAQTANFKAGDISYVKKSQGHYIQNTGTTDLKFAGDLQGADLSRDRCLRLAHPHPGGTGRAAEQGVF